jgi:hypothetical protein
MIVRHCSVRSPHSEQKQMEPIAVSVGELPRLDLEAIVPISPPDAFQDVARGGQGPRLPLFENMAVLVQHEPGVFKELGCATP